MKREIIATFEENAVKYARVKDTYWYMTDYYSVFTKPHLSYWHRMDTGKEVPVIDKAIQAFELAKQLGDKFESKTVRKILR